MSEYDREHPGGRVFVADGDSPPVDVTVAEAKVDGDHQDSEADVGLEGSDVEDGDKQSDLDVEESDHYSMEESEKDDEEEAEEEEEEDYDYGDGVNWVDPEDKFNDDLMDSDDDSDDMSYYDLGNNAQNQSATNGGEQAQVATVDTVATVATGLSGFTRLSTELQFMIWRLAQCEKELIAHKIIITIGKSSTGEVIYLARSNPPNPIPSVTGQARIALKSLGLEYSILLPRTKAGAEQQPIVFNPELDTLVFHSYHFGSDKVKEFLETLPQEELDTIQNIALYWIEQDWQDSQILPAADVLLLMNNLTCVTYLEDRAGKRQRDVGSEYDLQHIASDLASDNREWSQPHVEFRLDGYKRW